MQQYLHVTILSPRQTLFEGQALALSSKNSSGKFDILPQHANFITLIENQPITVFLPEKKSLNFEFTVAIIYTAQNLVKIYTDLTL